MSRKSPQSADYTIGWICALPVEAAASVAMLDEEYLECPGLPQDRNDNNAYFFGRIGPHNVVVGCLPAGQYGLVSATAVALQMKSSFRSLRMGLMVGIGGGVPTAKDIRLGDVVVSQPSGQHGGVVQYDLGKTIVDGRHVRTGQLNSPPEVLLTALSKAQTAQRLRRQKISNYLSKIEQQYPEYARPESLPDRLYKSTYTHQGNGDCSQCREEELEERRSRLTSAPVIHYGTIASGNQVMKDSTTRDRLSKDLGGVLCFEMEAAGLMNKFPCLVIRGIADYADSHKNDGWHDYAAATAAAFAKDLLGHVAAERLTEMDTIQETMGELSKKVEENIEFSRRIKGRMDTIAFDKHQRFIIKWLSAPDPSVDYQAALKKRHEGTGMWFLRSEAFRRHKAEPNSFLWLYGLPGCGKSTLSSTIIQHLIEQESGLVIYFYFSFGDSAKQKPDDMLRSLISQIFHQQHNLRSELDLLFRASQDGYHRPLTDELREVLHIMIRKLGKVFIVLDALDESYDPLQTELLNMVKGLREIEIPSLHLIVTSRQEGKLGLAIGEWRDKEELVSVCCEEADDDIYKYIRASINGNPNWGDWLPRPEVREEVERKLTKKASGMFRYAACMLDILKDCPDEYELRQSLDNLPKDIEAVYARILETIYNGRYKRQVITILQFLTWTVRPMRYLEIVDALAVKPEADPGFKASYRMPNPMKIFEMCSSLVVVVMSDGTQFDASTSQDKWQLKLAHATVEDYLISSHIEGPFRDLLEETNAKAGVVTVCLTYLSNVHCNLKYNPSALYNLNANEEISRQFPLSAYSAQFWARYARCAEVKESLRKLILKFLNGDQTHTWMTVSFFEDDEGSDDFKNWLQHSRPPVVPLLFMASAGLPHTMNALSISDSDVNIDHGSPIHTASYRGHAEIIKILLEKGADVDRRISYGTMERPLHIASRGGHKNVVQTLLDYGADVNAEGGHYGTALHAAVSNGYEDVVRLLLDHEADINAISGGEYGTALQAAASWGHKDVVQLLLDHGADVNAVSYGEHHCALQAAARKGYEDIVKLLLDHGAVASVIDLDAVYESDSSSDQTGIMQLLLEHIADLGTLLGKAARRGNGDVVHLLLDYGADVNAKGGEYGTALQAAASWGHKDVVQLLLNHGADVNATCDPFGTALQAASSNQDDVDMVRILLEHGADVNSQGLGGTALMLACAKNRQGVVWTLLDHGAEVNAVSAKTLGTALGIASSEYHDRVVSMLLAHGADPVLALLAALVAGEGYIVRAILELIDYFHIRDREWIPDTATATRIGDVELAHFLLSHADISFGLPEAAYNGDETLVRLLLELGADVNTRHPEYGSPVEAAALMGEAFIVWLLLNRGAELGDDLVQLAFDTIFLPTADNHHDWILWLLLDERKRQRRRHFFGPDRDLALEDWNTEPEGSPRRARSAGHLRAWLEWDAQTESNGESENGSPIHSDSELEYHSANEHEDDPEAGSDEGSEIWYEMASG